jgi:simple sugar transport system ATP-binding protein
VSLEIGAGEIHCLAGENGSGKSTLIKVISGVHEPDAGIIEIGGRSFSRLTPMDAIALGVQVIYQDFSVFPNLSVMENLALNMELMDSRKLMNYRRARSIAAHAVSLIGFDIDLDERVENLSVADRQLIAICRALLQNSKLIIMDEPTSALTKKEVKALFAVIKNLQSRGISILFVSHKLDEVFEISERYTIIRSGENAASGSTRDLDRKTFAFHMTGREFMDESYRPAGPVGKPVLSVKGLTLRGSYADVSFDLSPGEILGITGLLGSGRTELVETIFGISRPDGGTIEIEGRPARHRLRALRPPHRGSLPTPDHRAQHRGRGARAALLPARLPQDEGRRGNHGALDLRAVHRDQGPLPPGADPFGREPAEGRPRPLAGQRPQGPYPERTHDGRRYRLEV